MKKSNRILIKTGFLLFLMSVVLLFPIKAKAATSVEGKAIGRAEGVAIGQARGEAIGQIQGETRLGSLITRLLQDQRTEEIPIVSTDAKRREQLYKEYNL